MNVIRAIAEGVSEADTTSLIIKTDLAELKADLYRRLWIMAAGIVGLTVTLIKVLP
ncbi:hypothetical protein [Cereibacter johrii]|uniref:Uncharacterized protein n=1 Tax=Cereibacter johrii TaxID=445629 RepID=A0ABX5J3I0_9RHOB|nr:hypothetical protein [Cereibacter johrii]PTM75295.1 hypothetical protein C8J29_11285 [Cereibacter johrii]